MVSPTLALGLEQATLSPPPSIDSKQRLEWFELSTREDAGLSPISVKTIAQWKKAGFQVRGSVVHGPAFWQTSEIEDAPALVAATSLALTSISP